MESPKFTASLFSGVRVVVVASMRKSVCVLGFRFTRSHTNRTRGSVTGPRTAASTAALPRQSSVSTRAMGAGAMGVLKSHAQLL